MTEVKKINTTINLQELFLKINQNLYDDKGQISDYKQMCIIKSKRIDKILDHFANEIHERLLADDAMEYLTFTIVFFDYKKEEIWENLVELFTKYARYIQSKSEFSLLSIEIHRNLKDKEKDMVQRKNLEGNLLGYPHIHGSLFLNKNDIKELIIFFYMEERIDFLYKNFPLFRNNSIKTKKNIKKSLEYLVKEYRIEKKEEIFKEYFPFEKFSLFFNKNLFFLNRELLQELQDKLGGLQINSFQKEGLYIYEDDPTHKIKQMIENYLRVEKLLFHLELDEDND